MVLLPAFFISEAVRISFRTKSWRLLYLLYFSSCSSATNQIYSNINIFGSCFFSNNLLVYLVARYLQYFGKFNVIVNLCSPCIHCALEYLTPGVPKVCAAGAPLFSFTESKFTPSFTQYCYGGPAPRNTEFELGLATPNLLLDGRERESGMFPEACIRPSTGIVASLFKLMYAGRSVALF
jgi:hypothetical protein